jgi:hypothetical protein
MILDKTNYKALNNVQLNIAKSLASSQFQNISIAILELNPYNSFMNRRKSGVYT